MHSRRVASLLGGLSVGLTLALTAAACVMQSRGTVAPVHSGLAQPVSSPAGIPQSGTLWLIFLDDLHVDFRSTGHLRTLLRTICTELVQAGDMVGIVSTGPSSISTT